MTVCMVRAELLAHFDRVLELSEMMKFDFGLGLITSGKLVPEKLGVSEEINCTAISCGR